jgi:hypothetical protein
LGAENWIRRYKYFPTGCAGAQLGIKPSYDGHFLIRRNRQVPFKILKEKLGLSIDERVIIVFGFSIVRHPRHDEPVIKEFLLSVILR